MSDCKDQTPTDEIRIAVIAVHGVGDHVPNETARGIADLLVNLTREAEIQYSLFTEEKCEIAVKKPHAAGNASGTKGLQERADYLRELHDRPKEDHQDPERYDFDDLFMREQVEKVVVKDEPPYRTARYKGCRKGGPGEPDTAVHVYEMFWDDLSGVGKGFLAILGELYQLLFHLPSIGRKTVDFARAENPRSFAWKAHSWLQTRAARLLTLYIPVLNLFLLATFMMALPGKLPPLAKPYVALGVIPLGLAAVVFGLYMRGKHVSTAFPPGLTWTLIWVAAVPLGALAALMFAIRVNGAWESVNAGFGYDKLLGIEWWFVCAAAIYLVLAQYEKLRPGAKLVGGITFLVTSAVVFSLLLPGPNSHLGVTSAGFGAAEVLFVALVAFWSLFALWAILAGLVFGPIVSFNGWFRHWLPGMRDPKDKARALRGARAAFTARLSLTLSVTGFLLFTLAFYSGLMPATQSLLPSGAVYDPLLRRLALSFGNAVAAENIIPKSGLLHAEDFLDDGLEGPGTLLRNPIDKFASFLKRAPKSDSSAPPPSLLPAMKGRWMTARDNGANLLRKSERVNQLLAEYAYSPAHRAAFVDALNNLLEAPTSPLDAGIEAEKPPAQAQRILARRRVLEDRFPGVFEPVDARTNRYFAEVAQRMLEMSGTPALIIAVGAIVVAALMALWALAPSVLSEALSSLRSPEGAGLCAWMDNGLRCLRYAANLLYLPIIVFLPVASGAYLARDLWGGNLPALMTGPMDWLDELMGRSNQLLTGLGVLVTSSAIGLIAFRGRIEQLALGLRAPLQGALDVDNWLRERPFGGTPRGRIAARYISLLRAMLDEKVTSIREKYDAVVIVAHSQGTVITADLLRYLNKEKYPERKYENGLTRMNDQECPVYFLTAGSPLQQAYASRFPHLYAWMCHDQPARDSQDPFTIPIDTNPDPDKLGVKCWVNAYRSGDYIGRYFWYSRGDPNAPTTCSVGADKELVGISKDIPDGRRREICIGGGAHVHYFDLELGRGAALLARVLDGMIVDAAGNAAEMKTEAAALQAHNSRSGSVPAWLIALSSVSLAASAVLLALYDNRGEPEGPR